MKTLDKSTFLSSYFCVSEGATSVLEHTSVYRYVRSVCLLCKLGGLKINFILAVRQLN
ncbi:hypothetical protein T01_4375 [Trichinella spiralis]|uniref:Uncharacterized protein n=1 Tax=Trichinella spiralis TaxID=6334 RepID=A0A0V0Z032_TRISP|nr:hypothetical protein T01_4375 [Trichinella spiralis]